MRRPNIFRRIAGAVKNFGFKQWFLLALNIVLALASIACIAWEGAVSGTLATLDAARRFQGNGEIRYAQMACYLPVDAGKTAEDIYSFRTALDSKLMEQSLEAPEGGKLYLDAYYGVENMTISSESASASVKAVGVGGDFFYFHPLALRGGSYIKSSDLMDDLVVLDEETAWKLYGGIDLTGLTVFINAKPFVVAGVVAREDDFATEQAYDGKGGVYMSFSAMKELSETASITGYEIVMPNPITGYAKSVLSETFPVGDGDVVENSSRYRLSSLLDVVKNFGRRSMRNNGVIYPYWENAVRLTEDYAALLLALAGALAVCPLAFLLVLGIRDVRRAYRFAKAKIPEKVEAAVEKQREARLEKINEKKGEEE